MKVKITNGSYKGMTGHVMKQDKSFWTIILQDGNIVVVNKDSCKVL